MASQTQSFVFIDEDQQKKYSKSTLSAINSQVAKYAHAQKQRKPIVKSHSAPTSPPTLGSSPEAVENNTTQDDQLNRRVRRTSQPNAARSKYGSLDALKSGQKDPQKRSSFSIPSKRKSNSQSKSSKDTSAIVVITEAAVDENDAPTTDDKPPEDLSDLFQNLCRITKYPSYQAFPFFLNLEERRLAHYWFTEVLKDDFGMKLQLEDTFQGELTRYPLAFQVPLRWIIAKAADQLNAKTGHQSLTTVYRSREKALNRLQDILSDTNTPTDEAIGSILQSIIHSPEYRKIHLRGMDAMIESRGGLQAVVQQSIVTCAEHIFLQYTFADFDIGELEELESLKATFFDVLMTIQERARLYARMQTQMELWASTVDLVDCSQTDGRQSNLQKWSYVEQRKRVFSTDTAFGQLVRQPFNMCDDMMRKSRLFAALLQLSAMLCEYDSWDEKALFIRRLEQAAETTASPDPVTGLPTMMAGTHIFMTGYVSRQVQEELGNYMYDRKGIPVAEKGIAALKIFGILLDSMRQRLVQYLQEWLLGIPSQYLGNGDLSAMSTLITQLWLQKRREMTVQDEAMDYFAA